MQRSNESFVIFYGFHFVAIHVEIVAVSSVERPNAG